MSEMIERVAKAIMLTRIDRPDSPETAAYVDAHWAIFADEARAAIEAMRHPTDAMVEAVDPADVLQWPPYPGEGPDGYDWTAAWQAMLDAALSQPPHHLSGGEG